jgi:hypothetical protein
MEYLVMDGKVLRNKDLRKKQLQHRFQAILVRGAKVRAVTSKRARG